MVAEWLRAPRRWLLGAIGVFALQNRESITLQYLDQNVTCPLALLVGIVYVLGMLSGWTVVGFVPDGSMSLQARLDVNRDRYPRSPYGVTDAGSWSAGADFGYVFSDDVSATLFYTFEDRRSRERSRQILTANTAVASSADTDWLNQLVDKTSSIGFGLRYQGLLGGKLELNADAIAVRGRTPISTTVGPALPAAQNPASAFPDLSARSDNINLNARYAADRYSTVRVNYSYRRLNSADWAYQQVGVATLTNLIGTNEMPAHYTVHGVGISWIRMFQ